jgi:hypothetical protein
MQTALRLQAGSGVRAKIRKTVSPNGLLQNRIEVEARSRRRIDAAFTHRNWRFVRSSFANYRMGSGTQAPESGANVIIFARVKLVFFARDCEEIDRVSAGGIKNFASLDNRTDAVRIVRGDCGMSSS